MDLTDRAGLSDDRREALRGSLARCRTLGDLLDWARAERPPLDPPRILTQDEYTHDVVFAWRDGLHLAFDTS